MIETFAEALTGSGKIISFLPLGITIFPIIAGILLYLIKDRYEKLREFTAVIISFITLAGVLSVFPAVQSGAIELRLEGFMQMGLFFRLDLIGWVFAFLISFIWFLATIFSLTYMSFEHDLRRYYSILIFTLGATLGVVCSGDFFTLFLFFELMTFSSYVLVIHEQEREAMQAGTLYLYLGVAGGLSLLMAIFLLYAQTGTTEMVPLLEGLGQNRIWIFILFLIGFGIKAGVVPLHIWLPRAHPVAPSPASALLSGIMIKAGAYGILRVALVVFNPSYPGGEGEYFATMSGHFLLWLGIVTMFLGAAMALLQKNAKRILAYSSVSQMGYIIMGIGIAAYRGYEGGAMGFAGSLYHLFNHAFFKAGLFMMIGSVFMFTRELNMDRLGGMFRKMPLIGILFLISAFGIAGIPGFNGYPSKTLLHDALLYAYKDLGFFSIYLAEKIFVLTSALTICYFIKLFRGVFLGPVPPELDREYRFPLPVKLSLGTFAVVIMTIGFFPNLVLDRFILPATHLLNFKAKSIDYMIGFKFWEWHPLEAMVIVILLAGLIFLAGDRWKLFNIIPPRWLSIEYSLYRPVTGGLLNLLCRIGPFLDLGVNNIYSRSGETARRWCGYIGTVDSTVDNLYELTGSKARTLTDRAARMDRALNDAYEKTGQVGQGLVRGTQNLDQALDKTYEKTGQFGLELVKGSQRLDEALDKAYEKTGSSARKLVTSQENDVEEISEKETKKQETTFPKNLKGWDIKNLNFDSLLLAIVLGVVLFVLFYYGK